MPRWAKPFAQFAKYKCAYGGRASGKTWAIARLLVGEAASIPLRIVCCRAIQASIKESTKQTIEIAIKHLGLQDFFEIRQHTILGANGSYIFFSGLEANRESIRGWEDVERVWVDEAHMMSTATARILIPTIRKESASLYFTFNPRHRTDWVWKRFVQHPRKDDVIAKVNWRDNPWFPQTSEVERQADYEGNPDQYAHIWEGEPDDEGGDRQVVPYGLLRTCVDAHKQMPVAALDGAVDVGLDVADSGPAWNAMVTRQGSLIAMAEKWRSNVVWKTARRADTHCADVQARRLYYDAQGVGAGVRSELSKLQRTYRALPVGFGESVRGQDRLFSYRVTNGAMFMRRNAQLGWALRLRAENTRKLLDGQEVDPKKCLFIHPKIRRLEEFLGELSQPTWRENELGKITLTKRDEAEPSPDLYDATALAFSRDSDRGLRQR